MNLKIVESDVELQRAVEAGERILLGEEHGWFSACEVACMPFVFLTPLINHGEVRRERRAYEAAAV